MKQYIIYLFGFCFLIVSLSGCSGQDSDSEEAAVTKAESIEAAPIQEKQILNKDAQATENSDHETMLNSDDPQLAANKRLVYDMWRTLIDAHDVEAGKKYIDENYIQHSPVKDTGIAGLMEFIASLGEPMEIPERMKTPLVALIAERDLVVSASLDELENPHVKGQTYTTTCFDMYRIKDHKIIEHWDSKSLPEGMTPQNYVPVEQNPDHETLLASTNPEIAANKRLVYDSWRVLINAQQIEDAPRFLAKDYIQHSPVAAQGIEGFMAYFRDFMGGANPKPVPEKVEDLVAMVAEGDLVVLARVGKLKDADDNDYTTTWIHMWAIKDGLLQEHWDAERL
jgi:predicted SnoaL-like aldol condensation-catalyzing enzyme